MSMFCYQCQEAAKGVGCTIKGVCGKTDEIANIQDLLMYVVKGISVVSTRAREVVIENVEVNNFIVNALFMTITNANFDKPKFVSAIREGLVLREEIKQEAEAAGLSFTDVHHSASWAANSENDFDAKARVVGILTTQNEDVRSLRELLIYGLKGLAAYVAHADNLGHVNNDTHVFIQKALNATTDDTLSVDQLIALVLECGENGVAGMALLDGANTTSYGHPEITQVNIGVSNKPGILISGHDLKDMEELLIQTEGTGVDVYTHSEMLAAHYYPAFKKYDHFVGNYGNAWWQQNEEFETFNGPILFTTNCIVPPNSKSTYTNRVFTTGASGFPGFKHIDANKDGSKDFSEIIELAKNTLPPVQIEEGSIVGGFAHNQLVELSDKIVDAVETGAIRKFFVMAGCDGRMKGRDYYTQFAASLPSDTVVLTAGCAKYRYNKLELGDIGGIPRVLDAGQCNDSYSLVVIALKLKEIFKLSDINELPIVYNIAWYEQKAVIVLLALLALGVKNIHLGPTLPAFLSPNVAKVLIDNFGISGIGTVDSDMKKFLS